MDLAKYLMLKIMIAVLRQNCELLFSFISYIKLIGFNAKIKRD